MATTTGTTGERRPPSIGGVLFPGGATTTTWTRMRMVPSDNQNQDSGANRNANDEEEESWDDTVNYDKLWTDRDDTLPGSAWDAVKSTSKQLEDSVSLGIPDVSDLLDSETAAELKEEAKRILDTKVQEGLDQLAKMRVELTKDIEAQKRAMERKSKARNAQEETKLLNKIDTIAGAFLKESEQLRESTKLAAAADAAMEGKGIELGSWGVVGGAAVTTMATTGSLLGSVENAKWQNQQQKQLQQGTGSESTGVAVLSPIESRILIVADESSVRLPI